MKLYLEVIKAEYLYHVTQTKNVPKILSRGLIMMQTSNWKKGGGERYGAGEIYAFEHQRDAVQWAAKMDWEFNQQVGSGLISIIKIKKTGKWIVDKNDPLSQAGNKGRWLKKIGIVESKDIVSSVPVTLTLTRQLVAHDDIADIFEETREVNVTKPPKTLDTWNRIKERINTLENKVFGSDSFGSDYLREEFMTPGSVFTLAQSGDDIVGFCMVVPARALEYRKDLPPDYQSSMYVTDIAVDPSYQKMQIGDRLLNTAIEGLAIVTAHNYSEASEKLFARNGFYRYQYDKKWIGDHDCWFVVKE